MIGRAAWSLLVLIAVAPVLVAAAPGPAREASLLVQVTSLLDEDTERTAEVFRVVATAMHKGQQVILLFNGDGVASLKMGRWFGGHSTPIDRSVISERDRTDLAALLGATPEGIPDIYGSLLHFLKGRGLAVYVNQRALELRGIGEDRYDHAAEAVSEGRITDLLNGAATQISY